MAISFKTIKITPEVAARYLKRNVDNYRKLSKRKVQMYAEEMKAGKWQLNGEAIVFDSTGRLKNGQHRLEAILMSGCTIEMAVIEGVDDDVTIYDVGMTRSLVNIAQASGCDDITKTEAAAGTAVAGRFDKISKGQSLEYLLKHKDELARAYRLCGASSRRGISSRMSVVLAGYLMLRLEKMQSYEIEVFCKILNSGNIVGADGYEPSPALVARRMFEDRYKGMAGGSTALKEQTEIMVIAMQDFHAGKKRQLNYQIKEPMRCLAMMDEVRKIDGLG